MQNVGIYANTLKPVAIEWAEKTAHLLHRAGLRVCVEPVVAQQFSEAGRLVVVEKQLSQFENFSDMIVTFGGDGTMLSAARAFAKSDVPIMGFNLGKLGFLAEFSVADLGTSLAAVITGDFLIETRSLLEMSVGESTFFALNDFVVSKKNFNRLIRVEAFVNEAKMADYRADSVIIATPTGSTAYSLSAGGPVILPSCTVLCITPVSPHSLTLRPAIIPDDSEIRLEASCESGEFAVIADGQETLHLPSGTPVHIRKSQEVIKLVKRSKRTYFDLLKDKLLWSANGGRESFE